MRLPKNNLLKAFTAVLVCQMAGIIGSLFTFSAISSWYVYLLKPTFAPPNWLFGPAWTLLYTLMGISLYLIWNSKAKKNLKQSALNIFYAQLVLNALWSILFFGFKNPELAFVEILLLWILILLSIVKFYKINKLASYLLIPYILWVSFASILNSSIALLN